jgi:uncharacterized Zn finger protein (UPF0148 family)
MLDFSCPRCSSRLHADEAHSGKLLRCPKCGDAVTIPKHAYSSPSIEVGSNRKTVEVTSQKHSGSLKPKSKRILLIALAIVFAVIVICGVVARYHTSVLSTASPFLDKAGKLKMFPLGKDNLAIAEGYIPAERVTDENGNVFYIPKSSPTNSAEDSSPLPPSIDPNRHSSTVTPSLEEAPRKFSNHEDRISKTPALPPARSLPNGTRIGPALSEFDRGYLDVANGTALDAMLDLVSTDDVSRQTVEIYIGAGDTARLSHIPVGSYKAIYAMGRDWDSDAHVFTRAQLYKAFPGNMRFEVKDDGREIEVKSFSLTLNPILNGNVHAYSISEAEFSAVSRKSRPPH